MFNRQPRSHKSDLIFAVDSLRDEIRVLRDVLDEIREAIQWQNNNAADLPWLMSHRPQAESLNTAPNPLAGSLLPDNDVSPLDGASLPATPSKQSNLF